MVPNDSLCNGWCMGPAEGKGEKGVSVAGCANSNAANVGRG